MNELQDDADFHDQAIDAMTSLGLPEDEAELLFEDFVYDL